MKVGSRQTNNRYHIRFEQREQTSARTLKRSRSVGANIPRSHRREPGSRPISAARNRVKGLLPARPASSGGQLQNLTFGEQPVPASLTETYVAARSTEDRIRRRRRCRCRPNLNLYLRASNTRTKTKRSLRRGRPQSVCRQPRSPPGGSADDPHRWSAGMREIRSSAGNVRKPSY